VCVPVVGLNVVNISVYINHSKKPNLIMNKDGSFTSTRRIAPGEELFMDYDVSFDEEHYF
jgi:SET domain-containing protein